MNKKLFVGDSNVNIFEYFKKFGAKIMKFSGGPMKGIVNKNENYIKIINQIRKSNPTYIYLIFGIVDLNFYYYFKKYKENKKDIFEDIKKYAKEYVKIVSELNVRTKYVIGILPSPIKDKFFRNSLINYKALSEDMAKSISETDISMVCRNKRTEIINNILGEECKKYNINFCNIFPIITTDYKLITLFSLGEFGKYNIHHRYEYLLIVFIKTCLNFLIKSSDFNIMIGDLKSNFNHYIKRKLYTKVKASDSMKTSDTVDLIYKKTKFRKKKILKFLKHIGINDA